MLKEALDWVKNLSESAIRARVLTIDREPHHVYWIEDKGGELTRYEGSPGFRNHTASDMSTLVALAKEFLRIKDNTVSAWVTPQEVVLLHDDDDRRSKTTLKLQLSKQLQQMKVWENTPTYFDTSSLLLKLRTMFAEPSNKDLSELAIAITAAKFTRYSETDVKVDHGKSSIGKKLQQELQPSQKPIPTDVLIRVPIYAATLYGPSASIRLAVEPNLEDENYALIPMAGSYDIALKAGEDQLVSQLQREVGEGHEGTFVVYRGTP